MGPLFQGERARVLRTAAWMQLKSATLASHTRCPHPSTCACQDLCTSLLVPPPRPHSHTRVPLPAAGRAGQPAAAQRAGRAVHGQQRQGHPGLAVSVWLLLLGELPAGSTLHGTLQNANAIRLASASRSAHLPLPASPLCHTHTCESPPPPPPPTPPPTPSPLRVQVLHPVQERAPPRLQAHRVWARGGG